MKGYLHLQNGEVFTGKWLTSQPQTVISGEMVFFTGMTGYQEVLTDPSYKDQIVVFTYPLIGNYGINKSDFESIKPHVAGVIVHRGDMMHSHYDAEMSIVQYLNKWNVPMLGNVDTRAVVKRIRTKGSMPAYMNTTAEFNVSEQNFHADSPVPLVSQQQMEVHGDGNHHIVLMDFGFKKSILTYLLEKGCKVTVVPYNTTAAQVHALKPDGILLSNGPGDPVDMLPYIAEIQAIASSYPTMGICLGHQLISLAFGGKTKKLLFGHRGANQPVADIFNKSVFMTSQNHSYVVDEKSLEGTELQVRFKQVNDGSIEGVQHKTLPIITTQFHPEANPGPAESAVIFDEFLQKVKSSSGREKVYA
ncbi:carbamoyl phosphate synthase small subunit [Bacillus massiliigorillae]|uniref:carbamoyl phosphate synthase small subunit n=1 Tax=Bacillus massiliigorillae TaxID=1243664 RepID=UPI0003A687B4|nr:carbamoyl phosphate synthase small subunit [Bacillus massiliigorillae]